MEIKKILVVLEVLILFSNVVLAQMGTQRIFPIPDHIVAPTTTQVETKIKGFEAPEWARGVSGLWVIFVGAAFVLISIALLFKDKRALYGGIGCLYVSIILIIVGVLIPIFGNPTVTYTTCETMFKPDVSVLTLPGLFYTVSCIFTGYAPENLEWLTITTFIIFGICLPIALLVSLFFNFMPDFIDEKPRRVIAVVGAIFAFRGFFATFFIQILEYGFVGIGALLVGTLFTGFVWKACEKFISPLGIKTETALKIMKLGYYEDLQKRYQLLMNAKQAAKEAKDQELVKKIEEELNELEKALKKAEKNKT